MTQQHPISPPQELVEQWHDECHKAHEPFLLHIATRAAQWGAEQAEAALADIGDAEREPGDDLAWAEARAAQDLPRIRAVLARWGWAGSEGTIAEPRGCPTPGACACPTAPYVPPELIRALQLAEAALADVATIRRALKSIPDEQ